MNALRLSAATAGAKGFHPRAEFESAHGGARLIVVVSFPRMAAILRIEGFASAENAARLAEAALMRCAPEGACLGRLGGDLYGLSLAIDARPAAAAALSRFADALFRATEGVGSCRIGGTWAGAGAPGGKLLETALAAHDRRAASAGGPELTSMEDTTESAIAREALTTIRSGGATAAFQPIVDAHRPGRVMFSEALIRLTGPDGNTIPAGRFMPALARHGLTPEADLVMLRQVFDALAADPAQRLSVNLSPQSLRTPAWREAFTAETLRHPLAAERLIVEISEDVSPDDMADLLGAATLIRASGAALALDDFGAGRTSFRWLRDLRFDIVKIDGSFVRGVDAHPDNRVLISALTDIARNFDMMIVAEHVETAQEARVLREIGVDGFQGLLFGAPTLVWSEGRRVAPAG